MTAEERATMLHRAVAEAEIKLREPVSAADVNHAKQILREALHRAGQPSPLAGKPKRKRLTNTG